MSTDWIIQKSSSVNFNQYATQRLSTQSSHNNSKKGLSKVSQPQPAMSKTTFLFFFLLLIPAASPLSFNMSPITTSDSSRLNVSGVAYIDGGGIQVTGDNHNASRAGRATYKEPLQLWDEASESMTDFTTHFSFIIDSNGSLTFADGMAFFLAPANSTFKNRSTGERLGVGDITDTFVAVEFDTFINVNDPDFADVDTQFPHVGIDINTMNSVNYTPWQNNISQGHQNDAWVSYDANLKMLKVEFTGQNNSIIRRGNLSYNLDLRDHLPEYVVVGFSAATGLLFEKHIIKSWNFSSTLRHVPRSNKEPSPSKKGLIFGLGVGLPVLFILALCSAIFVIWKKKGFGEEEYYSDSTMDNEFEEGTGPRKFSYRELVLATDNFAEEQKLGEGGFGCVYKGLVGATNTYIAVKKVSRGSKQGRREYAAEVKIISQLRHVNLVQLLGWCHQREELLLVYEFMPNKSLDSHLFKVNSLLTWEMRYKIAQGLASALLYLHEELRQYVVHRDIKASNIMLDANFNAKLGDFGLARFIDHDKYPQTTIPAGTIGYMAPEYLVNWRASKETDIYSFGIVLLEIACGRRPIEFIYAENQIVLVEWVWNLYGAGKLLDAADLKLDTSEDDARKIEHLMVVGLWCVHPDNSQRPSIRQVMQILNFEAPLPSLPQAMPKAMYDTLGMESVTGISNAYSAFGTSSDTAVYGQSSSSFASTTSDLMPR